MDDQIKNKEQITAIKERLNRYREEAGLTLGALTEKINQETDIEVNYNTLRSTLDYSKDVINTFVVIGICRCLGKDIAMTLSPPGTKDNTIQNSSADFINSGKFVILDDPKYLGTFYGYFPTGSHKLVFFTLEISKTADSSRAVIKQYKTGTYHPESDTCSAEIFTGTPYCDTVHSEIFMLMTNDIGNFYFLYMKKPTFYSSQLYFSRGIALRPAAHGNNPVSFMSFLLLRKPIDKNDEAYVSGLLADISPNFLISRDTLNFLRNEEPLVNQFCEEFGYLLEHDLHPVYAINESVILSLHSDSMEKTDIIKAMMMIKDSSYATKKIRYLEQSDYYDFARDYLQKGKSNR